MQRRGASPAILAFTLFGLTMFPVVGSAQTTPKRPRPPGPPMSFFAVSAGAEVFTSASATDTSTMFLETATVESTYDAHTGPRIDVGAGHWFTRRIGFGVTVSFYRADATVNGTYTFPSPFVFDTPVTATTSAPGSRRSIDVQFDLQASVVQTRHWQVVVAGGPMLTELHQTLITNRFNATFVFPFTDITFTPASGGDAKGHGLGAHLGGSVARHVSPRLDLLGTIDWRHANATLKPGLGDVSASSDGIAVTGGLRVRF